MFSFSSIECVAFGFIRCLTPSAFEGGGGRKNLEQFYEPCRPPYAQCETLRTLFNGCTTDSASKVVVTLIPGDVMHGGMILSILFYHYENSVRLKQSRETLCRTNAPSRFVEKYLNNLQRHS